MEGLVILLVLLVPAVLVAVLRRTVLWWTPGVALAVLGVYAFSSIEDVHGDVGGIGAMANGIMAIAGMLLFGYAVVCFAIGAHSYGRARAQRPAPPEPVELPPVTVVKDLSNR